MTAEEIERACAFHAKKLNDGIFDYVAAMDRFFYLITGEQDDPERLALLEESRELESTCGAPGWPEKYCDHSRRLYAFIDRKKQERKNRKRAGPQSDGCLTRLQVNIKDIQRLFVSRVAATCLLVIFGCVIALGFMVHLIFGIVLIALCAALVGYCAADVLRDLRKEEESKRDENPD